MTSKILVIGASGRVGSQVVEELNKNSQGISVRIATSRAQQAEKWMSEGKDAVVLDLNNPDTFPDALRGVERVFLLTGYTADMLFQSKMLVDAAVKEGISHIVHLGVFSSGKDLIPHFTWHDLVETYIKTCGLAWTNIHPNVIAESIFIRNPPMTETHSFTVYSGDMPQGWVFVKDIAEVAATVLREGPEKHGGQDYWLSTEVQSSSEVAATISIAVGQEITCNYMGLDGMRAYVAGIESAPERTYMESALITMRLVSEGKVICQNTVKDDVVKVLGRPGTTIAEWAKGYFNKSQ